MNRTLSFALALTLGLFTVSSLQAQPVVLLPPVEVTEATEPDLPAPFPEAPAPTTTPGARAKPFSGSGPTTLPEEKNPQRKVFQDGLPAFKAAPGLVFPAPGSEARQNEARVRTDQALMNDPGILVDSDNNTMVPWRLSARHDFGHGVGYRNGFSYLEGFIPLAQPRQDSLFFGDARVVNFDRNDRWEYNGGGGYRAFVPALGAVLGANSFYDGRQTDGQFFNQIGVGAEVLHPSWELRCNGYFVLGNGRKQVGESSVLVPSGPNFFLVKNQVFDTAMSGMNVELGTPLPMLERWYPRVYAGYYHYSGEGVPTTNGVRGRLEAQLGRCMSLHLSVQHDRVFDTTFNGGLAIHFGAGAYRSGNGLPTLQDVLGQRVVRDPNVVLYQNTSSSSQFIPGAPPPPPPSDQGQEEGPG